MSMPRMMKYGKIACSRCGLRGWWVASTAQGYSVCTDCLRAFVVAEKNRRAER